MSTIHGPNNAGLKVNDVTRQRPSPKTSFGDTLSAGINRTADTVAAASMAAPFIPGGAVLSRCKWSWNSSLKSKRSNCTQCKRSSRYGSASASGGAPVSASGGDAIENLASSGTLVQHLQATRGARDSLTVQPAVPPTPAEHAKRKP